MMLQVVHAVPEDLGIERTVEQLTKRALRRRGGGTGAGKEEAEEASVQLEVRAALVDACEAALNRMGSSLEADVAEREERRQLAAKEDEDGNDPTEARRSMALTYRAGKKALLVQSIEVLRRGLPSSQSGGDSPSADKQAELLEALRRPA